MDWAKKRRITIALILGAVFIAILAAILVASLYEAPSCVDRTQNQEEEGIDCGGPCSLLCTVKQIPPNTPNPRVLRNSSGRSDLVALVENVNVDVAAKNVPYTIQLFTHDLNFIKEIKGQIDLPPRSTVPIFIDGVLSGGPAGTRATLSIATSSTRWFAMPTDKRNIPRVARTSIAGSTAAPRIEAVLTNDSIIAIRNMIVIALVRDATTGNIVAASRTKVQEVPAQGSATALFTWNEPFVSVSVRTEIIPIIPLP